MKNNGNEYIPFRIDVYSSEYNFAVEAGKKGYTDRALIFEKKKQEALQKKSDVNLLRTNPNKENYDVFYTIARIKTFISEIKNKKLKELEGEINKNKRKNNYKRW